MKLSRLALAVALLPASTLYAADKNEEALKLSETVITANRIAEERQDSAAAVTVFTREDIDRLQPVNVADLLNRVPGVQIVQSGGRGSVTGVFVRGTKTAQTLVLVDGVRIGSVSAGGASLQHLNLEQIERVEVLRGARSAMYGSDAIGGVIQIFTRRSAGEGLQGRVRIAAGNKGVWERSAGISGGDQNTRFNLSASLDEMTGFDRTYKSYDSDSDHDAYRNKAVSFSVAHAFNEQLSAGINVLDQRGKTEYDSPAGRYDSSIFASVPAQAYDKYSVSSAAAFAELQATEQWNSRFELGHSEDKLNNYDKLSSERSDFNTYRESAAWLNTFAINQQHSVLAGADYNKDKLRSTTAYKEDSRWNQAAFIQHSYKGELFATELGLRHDKNQQFGSENTWNAAISVPVGQANEFIVSYSEGFRAPTFNDLYFPDSCYGGFCSPTATPDLKAEKSKTYELQWRSQLADTLALEASVYRTDIRDAIALDSAYLPKNVAKTRINGFEASLQHEVFGAQGALNLSLVDSRDRKTGHQMPRIAKRTLSYDLDKQLGQFSVGTTWNAVSKSFDKLDNKQQIAGFGTLDLRGNWQATQDLGVDLRLANIFDKAYTRALYEYPGFSGNNYSYREDRFTVLLGMTWTPNL
ncbi:MAG TPA: TonB-dependent receptor [Gammaproteobacteria bacterium]|nr:TonB-dependent receptor [Gammaproteobacteria bacterium]